MENSCEKIHVMNRLLSWAEGVGSNAVLLFVLWSLWLAAPYLCGGPSSYVRLHDCGDSGIPQAAAVAWSVREWGLSTWAPFEICGSDLFASSRFPLMMDVLFFAIFPGWLAYGLIMWVQRFVAGYFTFRLLKDVLDVDYWPAALSGLMYSLFAQGCVNGSWQGFTLYDLLVLPGTPFLLWLFARQDPSRFSSMAIAVLCGGLFSLCSHVVFVAFLVFFMAFWFLTVIPKRSIGFWGLAASFAVGYIVAESPVILAYYLNGPASHRAANQLISDGISAGWSLAIRESLFGVYGFLSDNVVSVVIIVVGWYLSCGVFFGRSRKAQTFPSGGPASHNSIQEVPEVSAITGHPNRELHRRMKWILVALAVAIASPLATVVLQTVLASWLGFMRGFNLSRLWLFAPFLVIVCAGLSLHSIGNEWQVVIRAGRLDLFHCAIRKAVFVGAIAAILIQSFGIQVSMLVEAANGSNYRSFYQNSDVSQLTREFSEKNLFRVATIAPNRKDPPHPAFAWAYGLESVDGYVNLYPKRYQDVWAKVLEPSITTDPLLASYFTSWGSRVYLFSPFFFRPASPSHFSSTYRLSHLFDLKFLSLLNVKYLISPVALEDENLLLRSGPDGKQIAWREDPSRFRKLITYLTGRLPDFPLYIYENRRVLPRFFMARTERLFDEPSEVLNAMQMAEYSEMMSTAFIERQEVREVSLSGLEGPGGEVELKSYTWDKIVLTATCQSSSVLVITNNWSPYWKA
ncbi:MAG: hypothetical protein HY912_13065, partial [Desulfomonile tiedjei]|nr:hypothetical protein [Desulfomonile tiedjei]